MTANPIQNDDETAARQALQQAYVLLGLTRQEANEAAKADLQLFEEEPAPWS